jgi:hypothetical protein
MSQKSYDFVFKPKAIDLAKKSGNRRAAEDFASMRSELETGGSRKILFERKRILQRKTSLRRRPYKAAYPQMEEELAHWIENQRQSCMRVTRKAIARKAIALSDDPSVKASRG